MRVTRVVVKDWMTVDTFDPQPAHQETGWDYCMRWVPIDERAELVFAQSLPRYTGEGDVLREAYFNSPQGPVSVKLIDDGDW